MSNKSFDPHRYTSRELYGELGPEQIRSILLAKGLAQEDIDRLGHCESLDDNLLEFRIFEASEVLKQKCIHDFSTPLLAMLLFQNSWNPQNARACKNRLTRRISAMFKDEAKHKSMRYKMKIPHIQILRETTGNYSGNLYEARDYWSKFVPSDIDFQRSIRLPTPLPNQQGFCLSEEAAFVIGAIYAGGYLATSTNTEHPCRVMIRGDKKDVSFFQDTLYLLVKSTFNLEDICLNEKRPTRDRKSQYRMPSFKIDSLAIATWLKYDLGFPAEGTRNEGKQFPQVCLSEHSYTPFISGFVSLKGTQHPRGSIRFVSRDKSLLQQIVKQLQRAGIPSSGIYDSASPFIEVVKSDVPVLLKKLDIRNPKLLPM